MLDQDPVLVWDMLKAFGYDFWLNKASFNTYEEKAMTEPKRLSHGVLTQIMQWVSQVICKETKLVMTCPPSNLKVTVNSHALDQDFDNPINFEDDSMFVVHYPKLAQLPLCDIRYGWSLIKLYNQLIGDPIHLLKIDENNPLESNCKWLSAGVGISSMRNLLMVPIKAELLLRILHKTALQREHAPKIQLERLQMMSDND